MPRALEAVLAERFCFGQVLVTKTNEGGFVLQHRNEDGRSDLQTYRCAEEAAEIAKYDEAGNYRPLKTAPSLRLGWQLEVVGLNELGRALDLFYPGRLAVFVAWLENRISTTTLRETLDRQSGMYRVAAKISDEQIDDVVGNFCRSDGGCLRTILWKRDASGVTASARLPMEKFDGVRDQATALPGPASPIPAMVPLLCQEACNLLVAECRKAVKGESTSDV
ncbi:MAG: DR2241 family protein [Verrucomicrobiota bacterium]